MKVTEHWSDTWVHRYFDGGTNPHLIYIRRIGINFDTFRESRS